LAGCVHSSVNKPGANGRVSYNTLTHSRLYCRDREKNRSRINRSMVTGAIYSNSSHFFLSRQVKFTPTVNIRQRILDTAPQTEEGRGFAAPPQETYPEPDLIPSGLRLQICLARPLPARRPQSLTETTPSSALHAHASAK